MTPPPKVPASGNREKILIRRLARLKNKPRGIILLYNVAGNKEIMRYYL